MIRRICIKNFKSLADVDVELGEFTVLIGKNGAGKSAFLEALEVLSWLVSSPSINEKLSNEGVAFNDLVHLKAKTRKITWACQVDLARDDGEPMSLWYNVILGKKRHVYIAHEWAGLVADMGKDPAEVLETGRPFLGRASRKLMIAQEGESALRYEAAVIAHSFLREVGDQAFLYREGFPILGGLAREFAGYQHYQIWGPEWLRSRSKGKGKTLSENGANLASVIADLKSNGHEAYKALLEEVRSVYPWLDEIEVRHLAEDHCGLRFLERPKPDAVRRLAYQPSQVSDGFLRILALTALKHQRGRVPVLGYEEPENGLHPQALRESVRRLRDIAASGTQVIVTTHSPYLLDYLMEEEDGTITPELKVVARSDDGVTRILPVPKARLAKARDRGISAGELWTLLVDERELVGEKGR